MQRAFTGAGGASYGPVAAPVGNRIDTLVSYLYAKPAGFSSGFRQPHGWVAAQWKAPHGA
jgi:hypothetical protein